MTTDQVVLEGHISISAALRAGNRPITAIYFHKETADETVREVRRLAKSAGVSIERVGKEQIDEYASGKTHGGMVALVGPRTFLTLEQLPAQSLWHTPTPLVVMLDGVEDPFNFGAAIRSLYAAGADALIVRPRNWLSAAGTVARASAGASELIPIAIAETAQEAADFFRGHGLTIACATHHQRSSSIYSTDLAIPLFLLIGGEKRGITRSFIEQADLQLHIPYLRSDAHSLGTAAATAIISFEIMRQRTQPPEASDATQPTRSPKGSGISRMATKRKEGK